MFWGWKKKQQEVIKKQVDINVNEWNSIRALDNELARQHALLHSKFIHAKGNVDHVWQNILNLQKELFEQLKKTPDQDLQKTIKDMQEHMVEAAILQEGKRND